LATSRTVKVLALSAGQTLTQLVTLLSLVVLARFLTQEDLATYRQTLLVYQFLAPVLTLGLPTALYYFLPREQGRERSLVLTAVLALAGLGVLFSLFVLAGGATLLAKHFNNPGLAHTLRWFALYPVFALPLLALDACLVSRERVLWLTVFNVASRVLMMGALVAVCLWTRRPEALVLTHTVAMACILGPALALMWRACPPASGTFQPNLLRAMMRYGLPLGAAGILGAMTLQLPGVVVSTMCTPREFAVYSVGAFELPLIGIVTGSIATVLLADMSRLCSEGRKEEALRLFQTGALRSAVLLFPAMIFLMAAAEPLMVGLFSETYRDSAIPFRLYLLTLPVRIVFWGSILAAAGLNNAILLRSIGDLACTAAFAVLCVHWLGYYGAVVGLLCALYIWSTPFALFRVAKEFRCPPIRVLPLRQLSSILLCALLGALPVYPLLHFPWAAPLLQVTAAFMLFAPLTFLLLRYAGHLPSLRCLRGFTLPARASCSGT